MYTVDIDEQQFAIKPMNCPGSLIYYNAKPHSYKEFPMKVAELVEFIDMNYQVHYMDL